MASTGTARHETRDSSPAAYAVTLTADQVFGFADLVRRLTSRYSQDGDSTLRQELGDALYAFLNLLPEPSDEDGDAYLARVESGDLPKWGMDSLPLTETAAEWVARVRPATLAGAIAAWPALPAHDDQSGLPCYWAGMQSRTGQCPDGCDLGMTRKQALTDPDTAATLMDLVADLINHANGHPTWLAA
jgi:hypothetical protein